MVDDSARRSRPHPETVNGRYLDGAVERATPYSGRHTYVSLQIHAGVSPVTIAAWAGNSPKSIWDHYAREFERSRTAQPVPLAEGLLTARLETGATSGPCRDARALGGARKSPR